MDKGIEVLLSILYLLDRVWGRTYLQKLLFLLNTEVYDGKIFEFKEYKYGPFSIGINNAVTKLNEDRLIDERAVGTKGSEIAYNYTLTRKGKRVASDIFEKRLSSKERKKLIEYTNKFRRYSPTELLLYVYQEYPEYTKYSIFEK
ncbi:hypothetical protein MBGDF03_00084 [Thermoplasmatales archaeon SCGC AB-540-F20]|nr:hypothetical protein MBGDF03_00084 [Thermoplasmatales archaeon SCGC AB-540-F20]